MKQVLKELGLRDSNSGSFSGSWLVDSGSQVIESISPINEQPIAGVSVSSMAEYEEVLSQATENFYRFRLFPAPKRGDIVREIGNEFRRLKMPLAKLITYEMGKTLREAEGEVQEVIDIADFAVGLSRQLYGLTMHSERRQHRMFEQWHPLGNIGVITAFNFPAAVWAWNAMIACVCGNSVIWKPSEITPLTAVAITKICESITSKHGFPALFTMLTGSGPALGQKIAADSRFGLISATGSCKMGRSVAQTVAERLGKSLLELGGNNAVIVLRDADLKIAIPAVLFGAVGTTGQRCTTTRRVLVEEKIEPEFTRRLIATYQQLRIGDPLDPNTLMGPLVNPAARKLFVTAIENIKSQGGKILYGGKVLSGFPSNLYVEPTIVMANANMPIVKEEVFVPILYILKVSDIDEAIRVQNDVPQGLSSALFTNDLSKSELFLSHAGSDCGIANINIGTSGAEIGGAFGGEKDTGGGREAGSDAWKAYMRRQTNTINWGSELPLAQGIKFE